MLVAIELEDRIFRFTLCGKTVSEMTEKGRFVCGDKILYLRSTQRDHPIWDLVDEFR